MTSKKKELKTQTENVKRILEKKGVEYEEWLYDIQQKFLEDSIPYLIQQITNNN